MAERIALYDLSFPQLQELLTGWGEPRFRAEQVWGWLYRERADDPAAMTNLPEPLRARLAADTTLRLLEPLTEQSASNGQTRKVLFGLRDGNTIESVLMGYRERTTACVSSQVGCGMGCVFCATGQGGLARNLTAGEIVAQVLFFTRQAHEPLDNVVFMGMGEPLANYAATWQAIETLTDARGLGVGARRITISTVGLVPGIRRLTEESLPVNLAVSLHAAVDELRDRLVPLNRRYPLNQLMAAVRRYVEKSGRRVSLEYALIDGVNDAPEQARQLAALLRGLLCHVNLIPLNPTPGSPWQPSARDRVNEFRTQLEGGGIPATVRLRRGIEIEAGCGQLRRRHAEAD
jgi:23S rRNA (adenine2503-C2)-methyltransferase